MELLILKFQLKIWEIEITLKITLNNNLVYSIQKIDIVVVLCQLKIKMINIFYTK